MSSQSSNSSPPVPTIAQVRKDVASHLALLDRVSFAAEHPKGGWCGVVRRSDVMHWLLAIRRDLDALLASTPEAPDEVRRAALELLVMNGGPTGGDDYGGEPDTHVLVRLEDFKALERAVSPSARESCLSDRSSTHPEGKSSPEAPVYSREEFERDRFGETGERLAAEHRPSVDPTLLARAEDWFGRMIESPIVVRHDSAVLVEASVLIRDLLQALKGGR